MKKTRKLEKKEIANQLMQYREAFEFHKAKKHDIPKPRLTSKISESLAYHLLNDCKLNILKGYKPEFKAKGDLELKKNKASKDLQIKSTASQGFQQFGKTDINADYLLWFHFGNYFTDKRETKIKIILLKKNHLKRIVETISASNKEKGKAEWSGKINIKRLEQILPRIGSIEYDLKDYLKVN